MHRRRSLRIFVLTFINALMQVYFIVPSNGQGATRVYGKMQFFAGELDILTADDFIKEFRTALAKQVGSDLKSYTEDIRLLSKIATTCPSSQSTNISNKDSYDGLESRGRECEHGIFNDSLLLIPFVAGAEARKLFVQAYPMGEQLPGVARRAYIIRVHIATDVNTPASCKKNCAKNLFQAVVISDAERIALKQREDRTKNEKQAADAAATDAARRKIEAAETEAAINQLASNAAPDVKLVCLSVDDFIMKYGKSVRLSLYTEKKFVLDSAGSKSIYSATDTHFTWQGDGLSFALDRTTLSLQILGLGVAIYQCRKDQPQL